MWVTESLMTESSAPLLDMQEVSLEQLQELAERGELFAIIDACDAPHVPLKMQELGEDRAISLFKTTAQEHYWAVAPYVVEVNAVLLDWLLETMPKGPWGVFVLGRLTLKDLYWHFRKLLVVKLLDGKDWFFRFYDPRVLRPFLSSCSLEDLTILYGPIQG